MIERGSSVRCRGAGRIFYVLGGGVPIGKLRVWGMGGMARQECPGGARGYLVRWALLVGEAQEFPQAEEEPKERGGEKGGVEGIAGEEAEMGPETGVVERVRRGGSGRGLGAGQRRGLPERS